MNKFFGRIVAGVLVAAISFYAADMAVAASDGAAKPSIGVMDLGKINQDAKVMRSLSKQRDKALDGIKSEMEAKKKELDKKESDLKAKQVVMSQEAFAREVQAFQRDVREAEAALQRKGEGIEKIFVDALRKIQRDHLDGILKKVGEKHGYDVIISTQAAFVVNDSLDVTDDIIDELDKKISEMKLDVK
jgi:Skp family chaperone for outer membrane proteins